MPQDETAWAETTDGALLKQLFGYYPTLHDARIRRIALSPGSDAVEMTIDYRDTVDGGESLSVRIILVWEAVRAMELNVSSNYLSAASIRHTAYGFRADFELAFGTHGFVESERFEARLEKVDPGSVEDEERLSLVYGLP